MLCSQVAEAIRASSKGKQFVLYQGDCSELLAELPANSVSLIVSSPPYFMGKEYDRSTNPQDFITEHQNIASLLVRALKPGGSLCWQTGMHAAGASIIPLDFLAHSCFSVHRELLLRNRLIWHFEHGVHARKRFSGRYETVLWYTKGDDYHFDLDSVRVPQKYPGKRHYKGPKKGELSGNPLGKSPGDVWSIPNVKSKHKEKTVHPCQFPVALPQRLVRALTRPGDLVFDPYSGAASSGIAAVIEGRRFLGCEIELKYAKLSLRRYQSWREGLLAVRDWRAPAVEPDRNQSVARVPSHFWPQNVAADI